MMRATLTRAGSSGVSIPCSTELKASAPTLEGAGKKQNAYSARYTWEMADTQETIG